MYPVCSCLVAALIESSLVFISVRVLSVHVVLLARTEKVLLLLIKVDRFQVCWAGTVYTRALWKVKEGVVVERVK